MQQCELPLQSVEQIEQQCTNSGKMLEKNLDTGTAVSQCQLHGFAFTGCHTTKCKI